MSHLGLSVEIPTPVTTPNPNLKAVVSYQRFEDVLILEIMIEIKRDGYTLLLGKNACEIFAHFGVAEMQAFFVGCL